MTVNTPVLGDCNHSEEKEEVYDSIDPLPLATYERLNRLAESELYRENLLPVRIAGQPFNVILDTGADRTVISEEFYDHLNKLTPLKLTPAANKPSFTAGTQSIMPLGFCRLPMTVAGQRLSVKVKVFKGLRPLMLVGNDFICKNRAVIDIANKKVKFDFKDLPVKALNTLIIQPGAEMSLPVVVESSLPPGTVGELLPIDPGENSSLLGARIVGKIWEDGKSAYRVVNFSTNPHVVRAGDQLATFSPLAKCEVENKDNEPTNEVVMGLSSSNTPSPVLIPHSRNIVAALALKRKSCLAKTPSVSAPHNECMPSDKKGITFDLPPPLPSLVAEPPAEEVSSLSSTPRISTKTEWHVIPRLRRLIKHISKTKVSEPPAHIALNVFQEDETYHEDPPHMLNYNDPWTQGPDDYDPNNDLDWSDQEADDLRSDNEVDYDDSICDSTYDSTPYNEPLWKGYTELPVSPMIPKGRRSVSTRRPILPADVNLDGSYLSSEQKDRVIQLVQNNRNVFAFDMSELGQATGPPSRIHLKTDAEPVRSAPYRASPLVQEHIDSEIEEMIEAGVISHSDSEFSSPIVVVNKSSGGIRLCIDYRKLNRLSLFDSYPVPPLHHALDLLGTARPKYMTVLDLASGYWQIPLDERDRHKTAFCTVHGLYQFNVLPFGLNSSGAKFCRFMNAVLHGLLNRSAFAYVDDVLVASSSFEQHLTDLQAVFDRLADVNLRLKLPKCHFARQKVKFLGHIVSSRGIEVDPEKIAAVLSFPRPKSVKNARQFLGLAGFYRRHVPEFSKIAQPMSGLTKKDVVFEWTQECEDAMNELKKRLTCAPVLGYPDYSSPFVLSTDASRTAIGAILSQVGADKVDKVIGYRGRSLSGAEKNYSISELEALAIFDALKHFRHYLQHAPVTIKTDHQPLKGLFQHGVSQSGRISKWLAAMSQYNYEIVYVPGAKMAHADALSRREYPKVKNEREFGPVVSPYYDADEDSQAKQVYFPPLDVATQTPPPPGLDKQCQTEPSRVIDSNKPYPPPPPQVQVKVVSQDESVTDETESVNKDTCTHQDTRNIYTIASNPEHDRRFNVPVLGGIPIGLYQDTEYVNHLYPVVTRSGTSAKKNKLMPNGRWT